ncbi:MAG: PfkB family carbohydrate kinase [Trueperaceae bacterium]
MTDRSRSEPLDGSGRRSRPAPRLVTLGEALIDFVPVKSGVALEDAERFVRAAGGAPANVAVGASRLGVQAAFLGKVGDDPFGRHLVQVLERDGVDAGAVRLDHEARTALAFVSLSESGERDFVFYRNPSADMRYRPDEVDESVLAAADALHVGSISLIQDPARAATVHALDVARRNGAWVSYDPNLRLALWPSATEAKRGILSIWDRANVIKLSEDELAFLTGGRDAAAARGLMHDELDLLVVTLGAAGVRYQCGARWGGVGGEVQGFRVEAVDTTGAGDAFMAALLAGLLGGASRRTTALERDELETLLRRANACGALTTTRRGAIPALPSAAELDAFLTADAGSGGA